jgi:hypothetical protein
MQFVNNEYVVLTSNEERQMAVELEDIPEERKNTVIAPKPVYRSSFFQLLKQDPMPAVLTGGTTVSIAIGLGVAAAASAYFLPAVSALVVPAVAATAALAGISVAITPLIGAIAFGVAVGTALLIGAALLALVGFALASGITRLSQRSLQASEENIDDHPAVSLT